ncbi:hypothetical protein OXPF_34640 [Oxobacter pfennigii]|uniref:Uncharacterized protein n=1 Tax=Oxobacter pfennigii TaxID=36849 RepID=A0A0N8NSU8_9CLOT|nr:hypothetical protein [Oxobacter pfennigii]KPU43032.1 hypothetical protein OXPF_34640 [Oxobacter pfennigii]
MGTRYLICVVKDNQYKVAQYGQWDGNPEGQGVSILEFLTKHIDRDLFEKNLAEKIRFGTSEELTQQWKECGADDIKNIDSVVAERHERLFPENSDNTGSGILSIIQNTEKDLILENSLSFASNSLCDWVYVIDLDKNTYEVYEGFNEKPLSEDERFHNAEPIRGYYPVKHVISFDLNNLPTLEDFIDNFATE